MEQHAVIAADVEGVITQWGTGAEDLFGYRAVEAVGRRVDFIIPKHLREPHWQGFHRSMRDPQIKDMAADLPVLCADGEVRSFAGRLLALSDGLGLALGALAIYSRTGRTGLRPFG